MRNETRLKILKISCIYGGVLSLIVVGTYIFLAVALYGTLRYLLIQAILLPTGVISAAVFSYLHLNYAGKNPEEFACPLLPGLVPSAMCIVPGLIITYLEAQCLSLGYVPPVYVFIVFILGNISLILGIFSAFIVFKGGRRVPEGIEQWKIRGLQLSTAILITGLVVSGISISTGFIGKTEMKYEVMLDTSEETTFFVPVPVDDSNNMTADIIDELTVVEGTADWDIVDTEYGKALEVHTSTKCVLSAEKECGYMDRDERKEWLQRYNMSMIHEIHERDYEGRGDYEVWVFASNTNTAIRMRLVMDTGLGDIWGHRTDHREISLEEGWQTVELKRYRMCYD